jgi:hypothetical protein
MVNCLNSDVKNERERGEQVANNFIHRWSKRKLESDANSALERPLIQENDQTSALSVPTTVTATHETTPEESDNRSTSTSTLESDSKTSENNEQEKEELSVAQLLVSEADKSVKKAALRKLFMSPEFNVVDGLNDYDHDYASVKSLSSEVAVTLRDWVKEVTDEPEPKEELTLAKGNELKEAKSTIPNEKYDVAIEKNNEQEHSKDTISPEEGGDSSDRLV